jgi:hypothetical protein
VEEPTPDNAQLELLAKIHNHLVDLKQMIVEIENADPTKSHTLQARLKQIVAGDQLIDVGGKSVAPGVRHERVIAPTDHNIQPGEANK